MPCMPPRSPQLAKAGFYFTPIVDEEQSDCVRCFLCSKTLDGWTPEDKPAEEHCKHNNACPWVIACIEAAGGASSGAAVGDVSTTTEKQREAARVATFGTAKDAWWPHARVTKLSAKSVG